MKRCPQCNHVESDEALKFCRVDGATLINDSSSPGGEAGTAHLGAASEVDTSMLPHKTNATVNRGTAPTTVLPSPVSASGTGNLTKARYKKFAIAGAILIVVAVGFAAYFLLLRRHGAA